MLRGLPGRHSNILQGLGGTPCSHENSPWEIAPVQIILEVKKSRNRYLGSGYVISPNGIEMEQSRIETIESCPEPTSTHDIQVLGFANFYRRFIEGYSCIIPKRRLRGPLLSMMPSNTYTNDTGVGWYRTALKNIRALTKLFKRNDNPDPSAVVWKKML